MKSGGAWIFDNEIDSVLGDFEDGDIVIVHDFDGYGLGRGFINRHSKIRIRMMTRHQDQEIDEAFLRMRVKNAWDYRKKTVDTASCRVIFGEADFLPGLVVDKFEDVLVVQSLALGIDRLKQEIIRLLIEEMEKTASISGASMSGATRKCGSRRAWKSIKDSSDRSLIRKSPLWKTG